MFIYIRLPPAPPNPHSEIVNFTLIAKFRDANWRNKNKGIKSRGCFLGKKGKLRLSVFLICSYFAGKNETRVLINCFTNIAPS